MPVEKSIGEIVYAGGKQVGSSIELEVIKKYPKAIWLSYEQWCFLKMAIEKQRIIYSDSKPFTGFVFYCSYNSSVLVCGWCKQSLE